MSEELTLYDIMGDDHYIIARLKEGQISVEVMNGNDETVFKELTHIYAWDSLVSFACQVLKYDKKIQEDL